MDQRLAAAETALKAGRNAEAIDHLTAAVDANPAQTAQVYRVLTGQLYKAGRWQEGETYSARAVQQHPRDADLWNTRGVMLRKLARHAEALAALDQAQKLAPKNTAAQNNRGNVLMDMGEYARAEQVFAKLARQDPRNPEIQRQLGRALLRQGRRDPAYVRFRSAIALKRDFIDGWMDLIGGYNEEHRHEEAEELCDKALAANPGNARLLEAKASVIRRSGQVRRAEAWLTELLPTHPDAAWLHYQLGTCISDYDRERGNVHMRRAVELDPGKLEYQMALIESLERTRTGNEGENIEESYRLALQVLPRREEFSSAGRKIIHEVLARVCDFESAALLGDLKTLGRDWAETGRHTALLKQLPRVKTQEDRLELLEQHRIWGRMVEKAAAERPLQRPPPRPSDGKIRLGFMSSDLRRHPVGYFALPLFDHLDPRFEVYIYSYYQGEEDQLQKYITGKVTAYRWWPDVSVPVAAQRIAEDQLDMLIELGGTTHMNKLEVMAYRPARLQASWLGYPHSSGLSTIDYLIVDPHLNPESPDLLVEQPMMMPSSWIALGKLAFPEAHVIEPGAPFERRGFISFGTANNSYKYTPQMLTAWARVVAAVPDSRFVFVRPEGNSATFRANLLKYFTAEGVAEERVEFVPVRGAHMQHYNRIDVALDTFPQTGGTTTCEALWMGVPTVSLVGPAIYERLSYSILINAGLPDLCVRTAEDFHAKALELAGDPERIKDLRANLRERLKASPLGRTEEFARDFYDMVADTVAAKR